MQFSTYVTDHHNVLNSVGWHCATII